MNRFAPAGGMCSDDYIGEEGIYPKGAEVSDLWCYVEEDFMVVRRSCVGGQAV